MLLINGVVSIRIGGGGRIRTNNKEERRIRCPLAVVDNQRNRLNQKVVRKGGLEPPRYCYRQPLKTIRLECMPYEYSAA